MESNKKKNAATKAGMDVAVDSAAGLDALAAVSDAVESGAGLPQTVRIAARGLDASMAVIDASGVVIAVAAASPADEKGLLSGCDTTAVILRVADQCVGELRLRPRGRKPDASLVRTISTLIALEVDRTKVPQRVNREATTTFLKAILHRDVTDRRDLIARGKEFGIDIESGGSFVVGRVRPRNPVAGDWRARVLNLIERGARGVAPGSLTGFLNDEVFVLVAGPDEKTHQRVGEAVLHELEMDLSGFDVVVGQGRPALDPVDLHRAGTEALLAANVAEARRNKLLAFEESGAYKLLLPAMIDDPEEVKRFYKETVEPLIAYDEQYETDLVATLEAFLDNDCHGESAARQLHTHRHTVRYRLERIRELSGLDVGSTEGREKLSLGLKAMRVMGKALPGGPATEPGTEAGRVPVEDKGR